MKWWLVTRQTLRLSRLNEVRSDIGMLPSSVQTEHLRSLASHVELPVFFYFCIFIFYFLFLVSVGVCAEASHFTYHPAQ
jgi:hypothetical protein